MTRWRAAEEASGSGRATPAGGTRRGGGVRGKAPAAGGTHRRERRGRMSREEARVWMDPMVVVACMDLKH